MSVEIQIETHWKLTGRIMTAHPPVLSPIIIHSPPFSHCAFISATANSARI
jgi:hypothetical protein